MAKEYINEYIELYYRYRRLFRVFLLEGIR